MSEPFEAQDELKVRPPKAKSEKQIPHSANPAPTERVQEKAGSLRSE